MNEDNEFSNGANGRFDGLKDVYAPGGGLVRTMPPLVVDAIKRLGAFLREKVEFTDKVTLAGVCTEFAALREVKDDIELIEKEIGRRYDFMRLALLVERFDAEDVKNIKIDGVGRVNIQGDVYVSVLAKDREALYDWLRDEGKGDVVKETVAHPTLKAMMKARLEAGDEIPACVKCEPYSFVKITREK